MIQLKERQQAQPKGHTAGGREEGSAESPMLMAVSMKPVWQLMHVAAASAEAEKGMNGRSKAEVN